MARSIAFEDLATVVYLWVDDWYQAHAAGGRQGVGLAPDTPFRTKPQLAQRLLDRAQAAGVALAWVVGDTVHGHSGQLRS